MRSWSSDNPKAGLLARKREAILVAARRQFLANGYGGTSMDSVAAAAGVSIMTLYRHASSKDELFAAVVGIACHSPGDPEPDLSGLALADILTSTAIGFQQKLTSPETVALLRAVIAERDRFPALATIAFEAVVGHLTVFVGQVLEGAEETRGLDADRRRLLAQRFVDDLFGAHTVRLLLGLASEDSIALAKRATLATTRLLGDVTAFSRHEARQ